jgi:hypothetical protein
MLGAEYINTLNLKGTTRQKAVLFIVLPIYADYLVIKLSVS